jgi:hypothetical protein
VEKERGRKRGSAFQAWGMLCTNTQCSIFEEINKGDVSVGGKSGKQKDV